jgi:hypothetical protein
MISPVKCCSTAHGMQVRNHLVRLTHSTRSSSSGRKNPLSPSATISVAAPQGVATTGIPHASASSSRERVDWAAAQRLSSGRGSAVRPRRGFEASSAPWREPRSGDLRDAPANTPLDTWSYLSADQRVHLRRQHRPSTADRALGCAFRAGTLSRATGTGESTPPGSSSQRIRDAAEDPHRAGPQQPRSARSTATGPSAPKARC